MPPGLDRPWWPYGPREEVKGFLPRIVVFAIDDKCCCPIIDSFMVGRIG
jgi:hypothetical protein